MRNTGAVLSFVLGLAALSYAAFATLQGDDKPAPPPAAAARISPQDSAARDRMAQIVAEVAARAAAETAKKVALEHSQGQSRAQQVAATEVAQKSVGR